MTSSRALSIAIAALTDCAPLVAQHCSPAYAQEFREAIDHLIHLRDADAASKLRAPSSAPLSQSPISNLKS